MRVLWLTAGALVGFAANSLLTRAALESGQLDPASFTFVRLVSGALALALLVRWRAVAVATVHPSWTSPLLLAGYAVTFTLAYERIGASVGALVLFGSVQVTMIGTGLVRGERPSRIDWVGLACALSGLLVFTVPGVTAPDPLGTLLMAAAGACWGWYSLAGRSGGDPLARTAANFLRATVFGAIFLAISIGRLHVSAIGLLLAAASGALASGLGYTFWYSALPSLTSLRAAVVQLVVPVLTAVGATLLLGEAITLRVVIAGALVALGVWLTVMPRSVPRSR